MAIKTLPNGTKITTTVTNSKYDNGVVDISFVPYIAETEVRFFAEALRPERDIYFFFDGVAIQNYVQKPNVLKLALGSLSTPAWAVYRDLSVDYKEDILISGTSANQATVILNRQLEDGNAETFVSDIKGLFRVGATVTARGNTKTILEYRHYSGNVVSATANSIVLPVNAKYTPNNYWGTDSSNSLYLVAGTGLNQRIGIVAYDNVSRTLTVNSNFSITPTNNTEYSIGEWFSSDYGGYTSGTFYLPNNNDIRFRTGDRIFRVLDDIDNNLENASTRADYILSASGLVQEKNAVVIRNIRTEVIVPPAPITPPTPQTTPPVNQPLNPTSTFNDPDHSPNGGDHDNSDPLAQTFFVPASEFPNGVAITSLTLFFQKKDANNLPVSVQIRPVVNGYPHSSQYIPDSFISLSPNRVNISNTPNARNTQTSTTFTFRGPIFLRPGEWCFVVMTKSMDYKVFISELGETVIGYPNIKISKQPYSGSLFKSQNSSTWDAAQLEDLMFYMDRAVFTPTATATFKNHTPPFPIKIDYLLTHAHDFVYPNTKISYAQSLDGGSTFIPYVEDHRYRPREGRVIVDSEGDFQLQATLTTNDRAISPILFYNQFVTVTVQNIINNAEVSNNQIIITDEGSGYSANQNVALSFGLTAGNTSPVTAFGIADASGFMDHVVVTANGSMFIKDMTVSPVSGNALFNFSSELDPSGGPAACKYISRIVNLADGLDAGDLRVFLTATKPSGTDIKVYYKIRNLLDPEEFDRKNWSIMAQNTPEATISASEGEKIELEFRPSLTSDQISYTTDDNVTYSTFQQWAIKIVMLSNDTTIIPGCYDFRAIALPGSESV